MKRPNSDALSRLVTSPRNEAEYDDLFNGLPAYLAPDNRIYFWLCDSCQAINATVIGAKAFCKSCNSYSFNPQPPKKPVL